MFFHADTLILPEGFFVHDFFRRGLDAQRRSLDEIFVDDLDVDQVKGVFNVIERTNFQGER